ncbi:hypothetical protein K2173_027345 [Erythroxylum novogranatense]|uniref:Homeobox domain-containing protein n=1 Tax=Erythroxylum novogranatense TaxID=1862640 RepID=A0AAV8TZ35_9ROSI|nr:hypothetical protein K2173_027345 [Erythroxylum novogranatense]
MWMMGYSDGGDFNMSDNFHGRKLRPLMPRPMPSTNNTPSSSPSRVGRLHGTDFLSLNQHLATVSDQGKKDYNTQPVVVSSRWNPTPEQLRTLEELYRRGIRTPSADEIQHITAQLRRYGKIEGKNVFYWFQNHKARERQKRRRQMESGPDDQQQRNDNIEIMERKELGASRTGYEGEQTKNWAPSTNCSTLAEESASIQRATKAGVVAECRAEGRIQLDGESQQRKSFIERNATWQMMQFPCPYLTTHHHINTTTSITATTPTPTITTTATPAARTQAPTIRTMDQNLIKANDFNIFIAPYGEYGHSYMQFNNSTAINEENGFCDESQTLQLFPLHSCVDDVSDISNEKETEMPLSAAMNANLAPHQFFEFLPLKN